MCACNPWSYRDPFGLFFRFLLFHQFLQGDCLTYESLIWILDTESTYLLGYGVCKLLIQFSERANELGRHERSSSPWSGRDRRFWFSHTHSHSVTLSYTHSLSLSLSLSLTLTLTLHSPVTTTTATTTAHHHDLHLHHHHHLPGPQCYYTSRTHTHCLGSLPRAILAKSACSASKFL